MKDTKNPSTLWAGALLLPVCLVALVEATLPPPGPWEYVYRFVVVPVYLFRFPMLLGSVGLAILGFYSSRSTSTRVVCMLLILATIAVNLYLNERFRG